MVSLTNVEIGSVILNMVTDVPTTISGATLWNMVDNEIYFAERFTGESIGASVGDVYQPAIISLAASNVVRMMNLQGVSSNNIKLGDLSVNKSNSEEITSDKLREDGLRKLGTLGEKINFFKALG